MSTEDKIVTFESYYDPMLAHIVRTRLEDNGIQCFIADDTAFATHPLYNSTAGGIKVKVFEKDLERCREILASDPELNEKEYQEVDDENNTFVVCPNCASTNIVSITEDKGKGFFSSLINMANPFHTQKNWHCNNCQTDFE
jgi:cytochrome c peroxidase